MYRIVSTSLLLAAGLAVSACNVTTSGVTAPKGGTSFKNGHVYDIESDGSLESAVELHTASPSQPVTGGASAIASSAAHAAAEEASRQKRNSDGELDKDA